jgi:hypothetical protein
MDDRLAPRPLLVDKSMRGTSPIAFKEVIVLCRQLS